MSGECIPPTISSCGNKKEEEVGMLFRFKIHHQLLEKIIHVLPASIRRRPLKSIPISTTYLVNEEARARGELGMGYDLLASESIKSLSQGKQLHAHILINGFHQNAILGTKLVSIYAMHGSLIDARLVFDSIHRFKCKSNDDDDDEEVVLLWNAMIRGYVKKGQCEQALELYGRMRMQGEGEGEGGVEADKVTLTSVLKACADLSVVGLEKGKKVHHHIIISGHDSDVSVSNGVVNMYAKCGSIEIARQQFDKIHQRNTVSWNTMISGYARKGYDEDALELFRQMLLLQHVEPNMVTFTSVLPAFAQLAALQMGKEIHAYIIRRGVVTDVFVLNALIDMYAKCGNLEDAKHLFDKMPKKDVGSWNSMIACYSQNGQCHQALNLFHQMELAGMQPDSVTIVIILPVCAHLEALQFGKKIHDFVIRSGLLSSAMVCNALIDMYAKCRSLEIARQIFDAMSFKEVTSWNAIISGYSYNGHINEALNLYRQMDRYGVLPDPVSMITILPISIQLGDLQQGKEIHNCIIKNGFNSEVSVGNALLDMYVKCGSLHSARHVFDRMSRRDLLSWSGMIAGYGMHGDGMEALTLFYKMEQAGVKPDYITFIGVLSACSHAGLVDEGWLHFNRMRRHYCIIPTVDHYACMVDLLGRAGQLNEAFNMIETMPLKPDAGVFGAFLGACRIHCNVKLGEWAAEQLFDLEPENVGYYVLLSNLYADVGRWDGVAKIRTMIKDRGLKKWPGCSWIEVENRLHTFRAGDKSHPQAEKIYVMLDRLSEEMKNSGYVPNTSSVIHNVD